MKNVSFHWPPLEAALSIFNIALFAKKHFFWEQSNKHKKKGIAISAKIISFLKVCIWKRPVW
jgi:hypothetical protein